MNRRVVIVHCWEGSPDYCWYQSVRAELERYWFKVDVLAMPTPDEPSRETWVEALKEAVGEPTEELYLVGHSIGVATILRFLESLDEGKKIGGAVFVAGYTDDLGYKELSSFFTEPFNFEKIKTTAKHFVAIYSDNDPFVSLTHSVTFRNELNAETILKKDAKHFDGSHDKKDSCLSLPEVTQAIVKMSETKI